MMRRSKWPEPPSTGRGKPTWFPGKKQDPVTTNHTAEVIQSLNRAARRSKTSKSDLLEYAWRKAIGLPVPDAMEELMTRARLGSPAETRPDQGWSGALVV